jgi:hypothetical protein
VELVNAEIAVKQYMLYRDETGRASGRFLQSALRAYAAAICAAITQTLRLARQVLNM